MPNTTLAALFGLLLALSGQPSPATPILAAYVRALGGEAALSADSTRVTSGRFDNGRGLNVRFQILEKAPNKRVILIGSRPIASDEGSGRGFDGESGWDKNFIGTGLRQLAGPELADLARDADFLRPVHLADACTTVTVTDADGPAPIVKCMRADGRSERFAFASRTGLLARQEAELPNGHGVLVTPYEDYKTAGGVQLPHRIQFAAPGTTVTYTIERVEHNIPIADAVFSPPSR